MILMFGTVKARRSNLACAESSSCSLSKSSTNSRPSILTSNWAAEATTQSRPRWRAQATNRDGQITAFWTASADPEAALEFWG